MIQSDTDTQMMLIYKFANIRISIFVDVNTTLTNRRFLCYNIALFRNGVDNQERRQQ